MVLPLRQFEGFLLTSPRTRNNQLSPLQRLPSRRLPFRPQGVRLPLQPPPPIRRQGNERASRLARQRMRKGTSTLSSGVGAWVLNVWRADPGLPGGGIAGAKADSLLVLRTEVAQLPKSGRTPSSSPPPPALGAPLSPSPTLPPPSPPHRPPPSFPRWPFLQPRRTTLANDPTRARVLSGTSLGPTQIKGCSTQMSRNRS